MYGAVWFCTQIKRGDSWSSVPLIHTCVPMRERWSRGLGWCWSRQVRERQTGAVTLPEPRVIQRWMLLEKRMRRTRGQTRGGEGHRGHSRELWVMSNRETRLMWSLIPDGNRIGRWEWLWGERIICYHFAQFVRSSGWHVTPLYL